MWANVAKCLNSVIAMVDKLQDEDNSKQEPVPEQQLADVITSHNPGKLLFTLFRLKFLSQQISCIRER